MPDPADRIEMLLLDVDGVLTDGSITYDAEGNELKSFSVRDGFGLKLWRESGRRAAIITGRGGEAVRRRALELGLDPVLEGADDKAQAVALVTQLTGIDPSAMAAVGDDVPDIAMFEAVGLSLAPSNAEQAVAARADITLTRPGGRGAVREAVERLLRRENALDKALARYGVTP